MTTAKNVILTAINFKGIEQVKNESKQLSHNLFCSEAYVKSVIKQVEKRNVLIKGQ